MTGPLITFDEVGFSYGAIPALQRVSFSIGDGEFVAVVGPNGSGKSTLARLCNGLLTPDEGVITVGGIPFGPSLSDAEAEGLWQVRRLVGMVFQHPDNQIVGATVEEDVAFGPENLGLPPEEIRRRVDRALRQVGVEALRHRPPYELSGGQKQLVALAGVLAMQPRGIILDEVTAMLDPGSAAHVLDVIGRLHQEHGLTVIHITHRMEEVARAHRVLVLVDGRLRAVARPADLFAQGEALRAWGLEAPPVIHLAERLRAGGLALPPLSGDVNEVVEALWRFASAD